MIDPTNGTYYTQYLIFRTEDLLIAAPLAVLKQGSLQRALYFTRRASTFLARRPFAGNPIACGDLP